MTSIADAYRRVARDAAQWRAGGVRAAVLGGLPIVLALAIWRLAVGDGGRHPATLAAVQTLVFSLCALLVALGAVRRVALIRPLAVLAAVAALSAAWSVRSDSSVRDLLLWLTYLGIVVIVSSSLGTPRGARLFSDGLLVVGAWLSLIGLYLFWGAATANLRWYSTFYAPNAFAAFLLLMFPLAVTRCALARGRREAIDYGAVTVLLGTAFVLTYSRGAYLALVLTVGAAALAWRPGGWKALRRAAIAAAVIALAVTLLTRAPGTVLVRSTELLASGNSSIHDRLGFWRSAFAIFLDYPLLGSGPGTFAFVHGRYQGRYYAQDAHNLYLQALAETGIVGTAALAAVVASLGALWLLTLRKSRGSDDYALIAGTGLSLLAFFMHSAVEMNWHFPANPVVAFALAGVLASYDRWGAAGAGAPGRVLRPAVLRAAVVLLLLAAAAASQIVRTADGEFARGRRLVAARQWPAALQRFQETTALNPLDPRAPSAQAVVLQNMGRHVAALPRIRRAMVLDRMNAYYPLQMAEALMPGVERPATAREVERLLLLALDLDPFHYPEAYRRLAQLYAGDGREVDADAVYARAGTLYRSRTIATDSVLRFRLWPRVAALFSEWAVFTAARGTTDEAVGVLDDLLRQDPTWQPAYRQIADLYLQEGRWHDAAHALVAGWAQRPENLAHAPRPSRLWTAFPRAYPR